jgi:hypothetical protein
MKANTHEPTPMNVARSMIYPILTPSPNTWLGIIVAVLVYGYMMILTPSNDTKIDTFEIHCNSANTSECYLYRLPGSIHVGSILAYANIVSLVMVICSLLVSRKITPVQSRILYVVFHILTNTLGYDFVHLSIYGHTNGVVELFLVIRILYEFSVAFLLIAELYRGDSYPISLIFAVIAWSLPIFIPTYPKPGAVVLYMLFPVLKVSYLIAVCADISGDYRVVYNNFTIPNLFVLYLPIDCLYKFSVLAFA